MLYDDNKCLNHLVYLSLFSLQVLCNKNTMQKYHQSGIFYFILFYITNAEWNDAYNPQHFLLFTLGIISSIHWLCLLTHFGKIAKFRLVNKPTRTWSNNKLISLWFLNVECCVSQLSPLAPAHTPFPHRLFSSPCPVSPALHACITDDDITCSCHHTH